MERALVSPGGDLLVGHFIGGEAIAPPAGPRMPIVNPATGCLIGLVALGGRSEIDQAVSEAQSAFFVYRQIPVAGRIELLRAIRERYKARYEDLAQAICREMGAPITFSRMAQVSSGLAHLATTMKVLDGYAFEHRLGSSQICEEPIGVCGLITPWNWPMNQMVCKVAAALAAGCAVVLKPSEFAPLSSAIFAEILVAADVPPGLVNIVNGIGLEAGSALASHPGVDMISFTGSTAAGIAVARAAAPTVKRVQQELGGKSASIVLPSADLEKVVSIAAAACFRNSGQSCGAPTRLLVPKSKHAETEKIVRGVAETTRVGDPLAEDTMMGPVANKAQYERVRNHIRGAIESKAKLLTGGLAAPPGATNGGFYVAPTVFSDVSPDLAIANEEIFGPVLCVMPYEDEDDAVRIADSTPYGLAAYVQAGTVDEAVALGKCLRSGSVYVNNPPVDPAAPFGGMKMSGNGREYGVFGLKEYLEIKAVVGAYV